MNIKSEADKKGGVISLRLPRELDEWVRWKVGRGEARKVGEVVEECVMVARERDVRGVK